jgi:hypothetical protein
MHFINGRFSRVDVRTGEIKSLAISDLLNSMGISHRDQIDMSLHGVCPICQGKMDSSKSPSICEADKKLFWLVTGHLGDKTKLVAKALFNGIATSKRPGETGPGRVPYTALEFCFASRKAAGKGPANEAQLIAQAQVGKCSCCDSHVTPPNGNYVHLCNECLANWDQASKIAIDGVLPMILAEAKSFRFDFAKKTTVEDVKREWSERQAREAAAKAEKAKAPVTVTFQSGVKAHDVKHEGRPITWDGVAATVEPGPRSAVVSIAADAWQRSLKEYFRRMD